MSGYAMAEFYPHLASVSAVAIAALARRCTSAALRARIGAPIRPT